ncbi:MAG: hypothetical protein GC159_14945 [Phycisphaera sp.]|nr:hypothetical protein [Phycisphaera sp.]
MDEATPTKLKQGLMTIRVIWFGLVMGLTFFALIMVFVVSSPEPPATGVAATREPTEILGLDLMVFMAIAMVAVVAPTGLVVRTVIFKRAEINGVVPIQQYNSGCIIGWACCEGPAFFSLVAAFLTHDMLPNLWPAAIAYVALLLQFPTGKPLYPKRDQYATGPIQEK